MNVGENVERLRTLRGMTQQELADALSVSRPMIAQIERGTKSLTMQLAAKMAVVLNCEITDFLSIAKQE